MWGSSSGGKLVASGSSVRKPHAYCYCYEVPPPTLPEELLSMLTGGVASDLTLEAAYGEAPPMYAPLHPLPAPARPRPRSRSRPLHRPRSDPVRRYFPCHSILLGLRSPVFRAALTHGMSESTSRTITVSTAIVTRAIVSIAIVA